MLLNLMRNRIWKRIKPINEELGWDESYLLSHQEELDINKICGVEQY